MSGKDPRSVGIWRTGLPPLVRTGRPVLVADGDWFGEARAPYPAELSCHPVTPPPGVPSSGA
jgi:hypothetical protein